MSTERSTVCTSSAPVAATSRFMRSLLLVFGLGAAACDDIPIVGSFTIYDAVSQTPIQGAKVAYGNQTTTTDADGKVNILFPGRTAFEVIATPANYVPIHFFGITESTSFGMSRALFTETQLNQLAGALGTTYDPTKAIIAVNGADASFASLAQPMKVDTTAAYGFALVPDGSSPARYKKANTTVAREPCQVFLVNVTPGAVPLTVTPPSGLSCTVYPSSTRQGAEAVVGYAHEISTLSLVCK